MKIHLDLFQEIAILDVEQAVSDRSIQVLLAGFKKLTETGAKALYVDLTRAELDTSAVTSIKTLKPSLGQNASATKIFFVSKNNEIADFDDLEKALDHSKLPEGQRVIFKIQKSREVQKLRVQLKEMEEKMGPIEALAKKVRTLKLEMLQTQRFQQLLKKELEKRKSVTALKQKRVASAKGNGSQLKDIRKKVTDIIKGQVKIDV